MQPRLPLLVLIHWNEYGNKSGNVDDDDDEQVKLSWPTLFASASQFDSLQLL